VLSRGFFLLLRPRLFGARADGPAARRAATVRSIAAAAAGPARNGPASAITTTDRSLRRTTGGIAAFPILSPVLDLLRPPTRGRRRPRRPVVVVGVIVVRLVVGTVRLPRVGDPLAGHPGTVPSHPHAFLEMWGESRGDHVALTVGTDALELLLHRGLPKDILADGVNDLMIPFTFRVGVCQKDRSQLRRPVNFKTETKSDFINDLAHDLLGDLVHQSMIIHLKFIVLSHSHVKVSPSHHRYYFAIHRYYFAKILCSDSDTHLSFGFIIFLIL